jgi:hypothetical protein
MKSFAVLLIGLFITMGFVQAQETKKSDPKETQQTTNVKRQPEASQNSNSQAVQGHQCDGKHQHGTAPATTESKTCNKPCNKPCDKPCDKSKSQSSDKSQSKNKSKDKKAACCQQHSQQKTSK